MKLKDLLESEERVFLVDVRKSKEAKERIEAIDPNLSDEEKDKEILEITKDIDKHNGYLSVGIYGDGLEIHGSTIDEVVEKIKRDEIDMIKIEVGDLIYVSGIRYVNLIRDIVEL